MMPLKILVSCLVLNGARSGYRRIIKNLVIACINKNIEALEEAKFIFVFQKSGWKSLELEFDDAQLYSNLEIIVIKDFSSKWARGLAEQLIIPFYSAKHRVDRVFMPATFGLLLPIRSTVTFIHTNTSFSVESRLRGRSCLQQFVHNILIRITAATSSKLLFTTEQTHNEFEKFTGKDYPKLILGNGLVKPTKIDPISNYSSKLYPNSYLLSVSQIYRLKNFDNLIKAFIELKIEKKIGNISLVIVGTIQEIDFYHELKTLKGSREDITFLHDIDDEHLSSLYANSKAYSFYSLFEGYSLTPAEAMLHGKHISISNIPTHVEIYGIEPLYADPRDLNSIKKSIVDLLCRSDHSDPLYKDDILNKFSFEAFAERLIQWLK